MGRRVGGTVEVGVGDRFVVEGVEGVGFGDKEGSFLNKRRGRRFPIICQPLISVVCQSCEAGAGEADAGEGGGAVLARLPGRTFTPPVAVERDVPRVVRDDAVRVVPVDLTVEVYVGDGQVPFTAIIKAY